MFILLIDNTSCIFILTPTCIHKPHGWLYIGQLWQNWMLDESLWTLPMCSNAFIAGTQFHPHIQASTVMACWLQRVSINTAVPLPLGVRWWVKKTWCLFPSLWSVLWVSLIADSFGWVAGQICNLLTTGASFPPKDSVWYFQSNSSIRGVVLWERGGTLFQQIFWSRNGTHTHTHLTALFPGLPGWASTRKVKPIWILLKQETVSSSGISWAVCKSAPCSRQITVPAPHHSVFYRPDALPAAQPTASKHWRPERHSGKCWPHVER